jgi:RNA polymerase sigma-70 factor (ECF subfamily)
LRPSNQQPATTLPSGGGRADAIELAEAAAAREPADHTLVAAARARSEAAFETLVTRYYPAVYRFLRQQSREVELARDLTQETFLAAYQHLDQLRDDRAFVPWLYQIARNRLSSHRRSPVRRIITFARLGAWSWRVPKGLSEAGPSEAVDERELIEHILGTLSPALREAFLLRHLEGFRAPEIAMILDISTGTAQRRINRAEECFRRRYRDLARSDDQPGGRAHEAVALSRR